MPRRKSTSDPQVPPPVEVDRVLQKNVAVEVDPVIAVREAVEEIAVATPGKNLVRVPGNRTSQSPATESPNLIAQNVRNNRRKGLAAHEAVHQSDRIKGVRRSAPVAEDVAESSGIW